MQPQQPDASPAGPGPGWEAVRGRVLAALAEDPGSEAALTAALDRETDADPGPEQRVVAALLGLRCGAGEAAGLLAEALERREAWSQTGGRPVPLRAALIEALLAGNRRRAEPLDLAVRVRRSAPARGIADAATTVSSPAALLAALQAETRRARRFRQPAVVAHLHIDGRDDLLESAGAVALERRLGEVALTVRNEIRDVDWVARRPDGDFILFLAATDRFGGGLVGQRLRAKLAGDGTTGRRGLSASLGLAVFPEDGRTGAELLAAAERGMFRARSAGGNGIAIPDLPGGRRLLRLADDRLRVVVRLLPRGAVAVPADAGEGVLFHSTVAYEVGTLVELDCIEVEGMRRARVTGRVVRLEERPTGGFEIGVAGRLEDRGATLAGLSSPAS